METPKPIITPPAPQQVIAKAAPVVVSLAHPAAASVPNNDAHPTAVRLGAADSPVSNLHGPAVAPVNMGRGMPGMNSANTGNGPAATKVSFGQRKPDQHIDLGQGCSRGCRSWPWSRRRHGHRQDRASEVNLARPHRRLCPGLQPFPLQLPVQRPKLSTSPSRNTPQEAIQNHVEGVVSIHIRVLPNGAVEVLGITKPLGYGLDDVRQTRHHGHQISARNRCSGSPVAWDGVVNVTFQLAG